MSLPPRLLTLGLLIAVLFGVIALFVPPAVSEQPNDLLVQTTLGIVDPLDSEESFGAFAIRFLDIRAENFPSISFQADGKKLDPQEHLQLLTWRSIALSFDAESNLDALSFVNELTVDGNCFFQVWELNAENRSVISRLGTFPGCSWDHLTTEYSADGKTFLMKYNELEENTVSQVVTYILERSRQTWSVRYTSPVSSSSL